MMTDQATLAELLLYTRDGDWGKERAFEGYAPYRIVRGTDFAAVQNGDWSNVPVRYIDANSQGRRTLQSNDIVIETAGGSRDRPTGRTLLLTDRHFSQSDLPITCASFCRFLRVNPDRANPKYVYWYLQHLYKLGVMSNHQVQHTGLARFQYTKFAASTIVPLPSLSEQEVIVSILGSLDDKIELNRRMNVTLEGIARALFKSWFVDFDPVRAKAEGRQPDGIDMETAALFPDQFVESELGLIPKGWEVAILGDIATNPRRNIQPHMVSSITPYIGLEHMPRQSISLTDWGTAMDVESNKSQFNRGEFLFGKLRPYFHKVGIAPTDGICSTDILIVIPSGYQWWGLVLMIISDKRFIDYTTQVSGGTRMPRVNWSDMANFKFVIPHENLASEYTRLVQQISELLIGNIHQSRALARARDVLLPKLLSGEVRIGEAYRG
jgi:type I restriction enzyme S subunit